ncbi:MAG: pyruvate kinase, partial [Alphaproteobacteria bacterium]|nr:pyruvate kinase [Alphaproteobacteria bacterium]
MPKMTKITASIGPASEGYETLKSMIAAGVNVCRLNFSHDTGDVQGARFDKIRKISKELGIPVAIIADLQGPKHRIGNFETEDHYPLTIGQEFVLDNDPKPGNGGRVQLPDIDVLTALDVRDRVLLNDGKIELEVVEKKKTGKKISITTRVVRGDEIWSRRGFNLPDTEIETSVLTPKDRADLEYALTKKPDYVAISFVQKPEDISEVRDFITERTAAPIKIIVKIERPQAVERAEEILNVADVAMVARGDLAVEMPYEQIPAIQRNLTRMCRRKNRPVIIATQMLSSMVHSEFPLRAEISDVATTSYLRSDSTMLSEETTIGEHPLEAVQTMAKILYAADKDGIENSQEWARVDRSPENDWSRSVVSMAYLNKATAIVIFDRDGNKTREISCRRPDMPIIAICNSEIIANQLCVVRSVQPIFDERMFGQRDVAAALEKVRIKSGKTVIVDEDSI